MGDLRTDSTGVAIQGLLVRHLVLPNDVAGSKGVVEFVAREISPDTYINIMDQYYPSYKARHLPPLDRRLRWSEYERVIEYARTWGLHRGFGDEQAGLWL
ncbi:MAG: hypothetical protein C4326_15115 [Ignavibacteria bacterium]|mgnify:FL=1